MRSFVCKALHDDQRFVMDDGELHASAYLHRMTRIRFKHGSFCSHDYDDWNLGNVLRLLHVAQDSE